MTKREILDELKSGGMFVESARFVAEHKASPGAEISIHGQGGCR